MEISTIGDERRVIKIVAIVIAVIAFLLCCGWLQRKRSLNLKDVEKNYEKDMKVSLKCFDEEMCALASMS